MTIVFDTETTACVPNEICQLSYLLVDGDAVQGKNKYYSVRRMNPYARDVHGLSILRLEQLSGGDFFVSGAEEVFHDFSSARLVVGHGVENDLRDLRDELRSCGFLYTPTKALCTLQYFDQALRMRSANGRRKRPSLHDLCVYYGIPSRMIAERCAEIFGEGDYKAHDARFDACATYLCTLRAQERGDIKGVFT